MGSSQSTCPPPPNTMTLFGHLIDVDQTLKETRQKDFHTVDAVVDTIIRVTGGKQEAVQFLNRNFILQNVPKEDSKSLKKIYDISGQNLVASCVLIRIFEWTPEAEQARRETILQQMRRESTTTPTIQLSIVSETKTSK